MDSLESEVIKWIVMGALTLVVWFLKTNITKTQQEISHIKEELDTIKQEYLHKQDFRDFKSDLFRSLDEIKKDIRRLIDFKDSM